MSEKPAAPYVANPEAPDARDAIDDAYSKAYDAMAEEAEILRGHICLEPLHIDLGEEFLRDYERFARAVDAFTAAQDKLADADDVADVREG